MQNDEDDDASGIQVRDAEGNSEAVSPGDDEQRDNIFAFRLEKQTFTAPLTLRITSVSVMATFNNDAPAFDFDTGEHPLTGQTWELNRDLVLLGYTVRVRTVTVLDRKTEPGNARLLGGYALEMDNPDNVDAIDILCQGQERSPVQFQAGELYRRPDGGIILNTYYDEDNLPVGHVICTVKTMHFRLSGSWEVTWLPPDTTQ